MNVYSLISYTATVFLLVSIVSCAPEKKSNPAAPGPGTPARAMPVEVMVITARPLDSNIEVPGTVIANETTEIHPEISGRLVDLNIQEGRPVSSGTLLAKLYDGDLQARMRKLEVQLQIAEQTEKRQAELLKIQGISQQEYDLSMLDVKNLKADMDIIREDIRKTEIRAPFSGKLGLKNVSPGAYLTPSNILTTISQVDRLKIQFNVPERYSSQVKNGMVVHFTIDGSSTVYTASVVATEVHVEESTRSLAIRAVINQRDASLTPGAFASVTLTLGESDNALMVPNTVIVPSGRKKQLYRFSGGKAMMTEVVTGVRDSSMVQVLQGIRPGDTIITSAILFLRPGMDVEIAGMIDK